MPPLPPRQNRVKGMGDECTFKARIIIIIIVSFYFVAIFGRQIMFIEISSYYCDMENAYMLPGLSSMGRVISIVG